MIPFDLISILILVGVVVVFIALAIVSYFINKKANRSKEGYTSYFPSEFYHAKEGPTYLYKVFGYIYLGLSFGGILIILPHLYEFENVTILALLIALIVGLSGVMQFANKAIPVYYVKQHILISTLFMVFVTMSLALTSFFSILLFNIYNKTHDGSIFTLVVAIIAGLGSIAGLVIMFNPRLKDWAKLVNVSSSKDNPNYQRPKMFPLAYSEWLFVLFHFLSIVLFILSLIRV